MKAVNRFLLLLVPALLVPGPAAAWTVTLPDSLSVPAGVVRLGDLSLTPVPPEVAQLSMAEAGQAGESFVVTRQGVLRRLVAVGQAAAVQLTGSARCLVHFGGDSIDPAALQTEAERLVGTLLPVTPPGAPATWCEVTLSTESIHAAGAWSLTAARREALPAGRSQLRLVLQDGWHNRELPVSVIVHAHGEIAVTRLGVARDEPLSEGQFDWRWQDLAGAAGGLVSQRGQLAGASAARKLTAGDPLRTSDLKPTPLVHAGDAVELLVQRGGVSVSVRAVARQAGSLGQTIPVRNELTGRLVNARVAGPGAVEWRR